MTTRPIFSLPTRALGLALVIAALPSIACAQQDRNAERNARRLQLQMQTLQQQVEEAEAARKKADADKSELEKKLSTESRELPRAQGALRKAGENLRAAQSARAALESRVAVLEKALADQKSASDAALAAKDQELALAIQTRDAQVLQSKTRLDTQTKAVADCADKNQRLIKFGSELLDRYRHKGMAEVLREREPVLGFGDVDTFNLVQDFKDKADAERFVVPASR